MAFRFNWPEFDSEFYDEARLQLEAALNKGNKPKNIVDHIAVKELNMGTKAPELEILEIGELSTDKFRGIFKLTYSGDAYIVLQTKVQANPMHAKQSELPRHSRPNILAANQPLVVPMLLRISDLRLRGIVVLVVSKTKGVTLVFKNDPLENILISSTFDSVTSVRNFLQREIEKQLRNLFQEDLPVMIHNLSLRHIQSEQEKQKKQQQEERLKQQRLRSLERARSSTASPPPMSIFSDPGVRHQHLGMGAPSTMDTPTETCDCLSLPELSSSLPGTRSVTPTTMSIQLSSNESIESVLADETAQQNPYMKCDLFAADMHALMMGGWHPHPAHPISSTAMSDLHTLQGSSNSSIPDLHFSEPDSSYAVSESPLSPVADDPFADDADAPWYVTEGPQLPSSRDIELPSTFMVDQEIVLDPSENAAAAKLIQLANAHHTIAPLSHTSDHFTCRSSTHTVKMNDVKSRHKKIPKRRIIRLHSIDA